MQEPTKQRTQTQQWHRQPEAKPTHPTDTAARTRVQNASTSKQLLADRYARWFEHFHQQPNKPKRLLLTRPPLPTSALRSQADAASGTKLQLGYAITWLLRKPSVQAGQLLPAVNSATPYA
eukprot:6188081-Pleurochrysis_carterae.AAC.2